MDGVQLRDEAVRDRVRAALEFLDPSKFPDAIKVHCRLNAVVKVMLVLEGSFFLYRNS